MLIESDPHQTRIAVLEDDRLTEIFVERHRHRGLVGNVYKGRVTRVLPGMQAAFVDVGLERDAFLYVSDVAGDVESMEDLELDDGRSDELNNNNHAPQVSPSIDDLLKAGQEIIVQVVKDPLPNKGARISTHVTLPGRYLVLLPTVRHFGVSRRIEDEVERERLLALLQQLPVIGGGLIVRTAGEGKGREELESESSSRGDVGRCSGGCGGRRRVACADRDRSSGRGGRSANGRRRARSQGDGAHAEDRLQGVSR